MRKNNKEDMTISEQIEGIKEEVCDDVCRWREYSLSKYKDPDKAFEYLLENFCGNCPMGRL